MSTLVDALSLAGSSTVLIGSTIQAVQAFNMLIDNLPQTEDPHIKEPDSVTIVVSVRDKHRILATFLGWLCIVLGATLAVAATAVQLMSAG